MDDRHLQIAEHQETLRLSLLSETDPTRIVKQQKERNQPYPCYNELVVP